MLSIWRDIVSQEGKLALYRGLAPATLGALGVMTVYGYADRIDSWTKETYPVSNRVRLDLLLLSPTPGAALALPVSPRLTMFIPIGTDARITCWCAGGRSTHRCSHIRLRNTLSSGEGLL